MTPPERWRDGRCRDDGLHRRPGRESGLSPQMTRFRLPGRALSDPPRRVGAWLTRRRTVLPRGRSRPRRASTGSATSTAGSSTSARRRTCASRLTSYFQDIVEPAPAHRDDGDDARRASSGRWSSTEVEALQLEYSWIKEFDPRFNVKYRDDKSYPWLAVTLNEEFPRVMVGRGAKKQGRPLLRPLLPRLGDPRDRRPAAAGVPDALLLQRRLQALRADRPALPARLHRQVLGALRRPGQRRGAPRDRRGLLRLHGRPDQRLRQAPRAARCTPRRPTQDYERAARLRDDIGALNRALEKQAVVLGDGTDADVIALAEDPLEVAVQIFHVRGGRIRGQRGWVADKVDDADTAGLVERFLLQLYDGRARRRDPARGAGARRCPRTPRPSSELARASCAARRVSIRVPAARRQEGPAWRPSARNAQQALALHKTKRASDLTTRNRALEEIQEALELPDGAAAHRVLRHLQPPGHRGGRLDGGLRGRPGPQERVPPVRDQGRRRAERRRRRCTR